MNNSTMGSGCLERKGKTVGDSECLAWWDPYFCTREGGEMIEFLLA